MDDTEIKHVVEAALLAAGRPLPIERLQELFAVKGGGPDREALKRVLGELANDYQGRGIELKEVANGYRIQVRRTMTDWLMPLWEERAPRYTRALLETLALIAYRQPITRAEIEEVRGVVVSTNIIRTLLERSWVRVVGHRDVPGKPAMFGTTREFLDYFGLKKLDELPTLAEIKDGLPELSPQTDLIDSLEAQVRLVEQGVEPVPLDTLTEARLIELSHDSEAAVAEDSEVIVANRTFEAGGLDEPAVVEQDAQVIPLRARSESGE
jgi:segregation and condensation protein B